MHFDEVYNLPFKSINVLTWNIFWEKGILREHVGFGCKGDREEAKVDDEEKPK